MLGATERVKLEHSIRRRFGDRPESDGSLHPREGQDHATERQARVEHEDEVGALAIHEGPRAFAIGFGPERLPQYRQIEIHFGSEILDLP